MLKIMVIAEKGCEHKAKEVANNLSLPIADVTAAADYFLVVTTERLELCENSKQHTRPIYVDFLAGKLAYRRKYGGGKGQLLARAVGVQSGKALQVLDATAGFGQDSFVLATLGCEVLMLERSPIVAALLEDGLRRASLSPDFAELRLKLKRGNAITYMQECKVRPDVVYLDPMFPERTKSALVKKEMRILRAVVGEDLDVEQLLQVALKCAFKRVVVKRPRLAPQISGPKPDLEFNGKSSRFDVYLIAAVFDKE